MKPHLFGDAQREEILRAIERLDIGDDEGRRIFVFALEYELAQFEALKASAGAAEPAAMPAAAPQLTTVTEGARSLLETLRTLEPAAEQILLEALSTSDRFDRRHERGYLDALERELECLAGLPATTATGPEPTLPTAERRFVRTLAKAYHDCFESQATPEPRGPFARLIQTLLPPLGIDIELSGAQLRDILGATR
jgi:hypothetical protein